MKKKIILILIIMLVLIFSNCAKKASGYKDISELKNSTDKKENLFGETNKLGLVNNQKKPENISTIDDYKVPDNSTENLDRKIIKKGTISIEVKDLMNAEKTVDELVNRFNGYIAESNYSADYLTVTVKIPAEKYMMFISNTEAIGKLLNKSINAKDVTDFFYDREIQIKTKRILQERYLSYLKKAINTRELLEIERALNNVTREVEGLEGGFKVLKNEISYSELTLNFSLPSYDGIKRRLPSLQKGFQDFCYFIVKFLFILLFIILYSIIIAIPLIIILGLIYYIGFGKAGIIKRFFKMLSAKK